ncbi:UDP-glucose 4-epimerase family protein, partial [Rhodocyclaceae bacterium SMB388]
QGALPMMLVTGASGFVGRALCHQLQERGALRIAVRSRNSPEWPKGFDVVEATLDPSHDWRPALDSITTVIHCAARVHVMNDDTANPLAEFRRLNVDSTLRLATQASAAGVRRFVFISSIKVNGEGTSPGRSFTSEQAPAPLDPYAVSKWEAECKLRTLAAETEMEIVIIRPVLVYGPGVKANFLNMMRCLHKGIPLPLGAIHNKRSLVALDNLVDLIVTCIDHPQAANQTFLVSDGEDLSTTELLRRMSQALGKRPRLLPVPAWLLETAAKVLGKQSIAQKLCGSLQVDIEHTRERLGWTPPVSVDAALEKTARHFLAQQKR